MAVPGVKSRYPVADTFLMLSLLFLLTASYFVVVVLVLRAKRRRARIVVPCLPADDQPPASAVGWPPEGTRLTEYVGEGLAALDAYLSGATPPEIG